jgi:hypothetical protein
MLLLYIFHGLAATHYEVIASPLPIQEMAVVFTLIF